MCNASRYVTITLSVRVSSVDDGRVACGPRAPCSPCRPRASLAAPCQPAEDSDLLQIRTRLGREVNDLSSTYPEQVDGILILLVQLN